LAALVLDFSERATHDSAAIEAIEALARSLAPETGRTVLRLSDIGELDLSSHAAAALRAGATSSTLMLETTAEGVKFFHPMFLSYLVSASVMGEATMLAADDKGVMIRAGRTVSRTSVPVARLGMAALGCCPVPLVSNKRTSLHAHFSFTDLMETAAEVAGLAANLQPGGSLSLLFGDLGEDADAKVRAVGAGLKDAGEITIAIKNSRRLTDAGLAGLASGLQDGIYGLHLTLHDCWSLTDVGIVELAKHLPKSATALSLNFSFSSPCATISDTGACALAAALPPNLATLALQLSDCCNVTDEAIWALAHHLPENVHSVRLLMSGTQVRGAGGTLDELRDLQLQLGRSAAGGAEVCSARSAQTRVHAQLAPNSARDGLGKYRAEGFVKPLPPVLKPVKEIMQAQGRTCRYLLKRPAAKRGRSQVFSNNSSVKLPSVPHGSRRDFPGSLH